MVTDTTREDFRMLLSKRLLLGRALQRLSAQMIPVPTDNWLHEFNERCRLEGVEPAARPLHAFSGMAEGKQPPIRFWAARSWLPRHAGLGESIFFFPNSYIGWS
jgi:hypothetical protein